MRIACVGAGFAGSVIARTLVDNTLYKIDVFDQRNHIASNCRTYRNKNTKILAHKYGHHILNTSNREVWNFANKFDDFKSYTNRVKAVTGRGVF